ncbi:MAG TPA: DEAD/DEAH box helicase [Byssovorax sp.]|jgi:ATP-dependent RNA helicase DeaD
MIDTATVPSSEEPTAAPAQADPAPNAPTFEVLPLSPELRETLAEIGYQHPTPVQIAVWEPATRGRDAVVQARTGTGKTAAFGLPIVDHIVKRGSPVVQVLVLCPTRELAVQVSTEVDRLGQKKGVKVLAIYGGAPMQRQIDGIQAGAQVVVGTPGRVLDHLRRGTLDPKQVRLVVLDESDEMLSMGFERELTSILETLPPERQTLLFSATLPPDIERIAKNKLRAPDFLTLSGDHVGALSIRHFVYMVASEKVAALLRVLDVEDPESAVIFCNTKDETQNVAQALKRKGFDADWLNGDLPQGDREKVMTATREGRLRYLVATDVAARGIDISHLTHVINYDFPQDAEAYVHRTGRTGRAGRTGTAVSLVAPHDIGQLYLLRLTYKIRPVEKQIPSEGELKTRAEADLTAMLAEAFIGRTTHPDDLALARRLLTHDQAEAIVAGLLRDHLGARPAAKDDAAAARKAPRPTTAFDRARTGRPPPPAMPQAPAAPRPRPAEAEAAAAPRPAQEDDAQRDRGDAAGAGRDRARAEPASEGRRDGRRDGPPREPRDDGRRRDGRFERRDRGDAAGAGRDRPPRDANRPRSDEPFVPITAADRDYTAAPAPETTQAGQRPRLANDLVSWQPPAEANDDEPILAGDATPTPRTRAPRDDRGDSAGAGRERPRGDAPSSGRRPPRDAAAAPPMPAPAPRAILDTPMPEIDGPWVELYVNVGRRDGARATDVQRVLVDAGIDKTHAQRIRVRDRNAFVSVPKSSLDRALAALNGASIGQKTALAEVARASSEEPPAPEQPKDG